MTAPEMSLNKSKLTSIVAKEAGIHPDAAARAVEAMTRAIVNTVSGGGKATLPGFGTFKLATRAARCVRHPKSGETIPLPASRTAKFTPSATFNSIIAFSEN